MLRRLSVPEEPSITLEEAKAHLRVDHTAEDALIGAYLQASIDACADFAGRAFDRAAYEMSWDCWPCCRSLEIPIAPVVAVDSVAYVDADGAEQQIDPTSWKWKPTPAGARVFFDSAYSWPTFGTYFQAEGRAIRVNVGAGYLPPSQCADCEDPDQLLPSQARAAILLTIGHLYASREAVIVGKGAIALPLGVQHLLSQIRIYR